MATLNPNRAETIYIPVSGTKNREFIKSQTPFWSAVLFDQRIFVKVFAEIFCLSVAADLESSPAARIEAVLSPKV